MREACAIAATVLEQLKPLVSPGITTQDLEEAGRDWIARLGARSACYGYQHGSRRYPAHTCISVNDAFVMGAWGKDQHAAGKVRMLADGNGDFTHALGLELDASRFGLGKRSQRYAMVVDNGVVKNLNVEEGGGFSVSSAEHVLGQL